MAHGITKRQRSILEFIIESIRDNGYPPTIAEIGIAFGINSTNGVNDHLVALEKKGYLLRSSKARGLHLTEKAAVGLYERPKPPGRIPVLGRIAAGSPVLAEENVLAYVYVEPDSVHDKMFSLQVQGDSMIEDGIMDGDTVIVDPARSPRKGDIVVALVENDDATVKHFYPMGPEVELRPANSSMEPMRYPANQVQIQGVVVGAQRNYY